MSKAAADRGLVTLLGTSPTTRRAWDALTAAGCEVVFTEDVDQTLALAKGGRVALVWVDASQGDRVLTRLSAELTRHPEARDVSAMALRAELEPSEVTLLTRTLLELSRLRDELAHETRVARELVTDARARLEGALLGESPEIKRVRATIETLARHDRPVMVTGPFGAGHEAAARAIHGSSERQRGPFLHVDCAGVTGADEVALFGTGGGLLSIFREKKPGKWGLAHGGTIFFHHIDRLPRALAKTLKSRIDDPSGVDVRIIASRVDVAEPTPMPVDLPNADVLALPGLARRQADIETLVRHFIDRKAQQSGERMGIEEQSQKRLRSYAWPGNLTELESVIDSALLTNRGGELVVDSALLERGSRVGQYALQKCLGKGAMGEVWSGSHRLLGRPAAIKLIQTAEGWDANMLKIAKRRFEREARATASLESPNTVRLYDFGMTDDGGFYYVMELLSGLDLDALVTRHGPLPVERAIWLLSQACGSLAEAHDAGLVHRDIKPANLYAAKLGHDHDVLKVLDFGLVRTAGTGETKLTGAGLIGTPAFMAPEVVFERPADSRTDLYSLGCVAFWLLTGQLVFDGETAMGIVMQHAGTAAAPRLSDVAAADIPEELDALVARLLQKKPEDRVQSAAELRSHLDAIRLDRPWSRARAAEWWASIQDVQDG